MSLNTSAVLPINCPRCRTRIEFADIVANELECHRFTPGICTRVVLEPCFCQATSIDKDFREMVLTVERFNADTSHEIVVTAA